MLLPNNLRILFINILIVPAFGCGMLLSNSSQLRGVDGRAEEIVLLIRGVEVAHRSVEPDHADVRIRSIQVIQSIGKVMEELRVIFVMRTTI